MNGRRFLFALACVATFFMPSTAAHGQFTGPSYFSGILGDNPVPRATLADSNRMVSGIYIKDFAGITLRPADEATAREIIKRTFFVTVAFPPGTSLTTADSILDREEDQLLKLIRTKADSVRFLTNSGARRKYRNVKIT